MKKVCILVVLLFLVCACDLKKVEFANYEYFDDDMFRYTICVD